MRDFLLAVAVFATLALSFAIDEECIQRKSLGLPVHWPKPTDCSSFYRCTNKNIKRELLCPGGKVYNPNTGRCANKGNALCQLSLKAPLAKNTDNSCAGKISGTKVPNLKNCRGFNICDNNLAYPQTCDAGSFFSIDSLACEKDTKSLCWENFCLKKANGSCVAHQNNCKFFYVCYEEKPFEQTCPDKSYFDAKSLNCQPGTCPAEESTTVTVVTETTTTSTPQTYTTTVVQETTTETAAKETTNTFATETFTTTVVQETTTTEAAVTEKTTTCSPETTTTKCTATTTTSSCAPVTTTTCKAKTTTTTCAAETSTAMLKATTRVAELKTPAANDCWLNNDCRYAKDGFVFAARSTISGFCVCLNQQPVYRECSSNAIFSESLQICVAQDNVCPSRKCFQRPNYTNFPATNTTTGFCRCLNGQAKFFKCLGADFVYNNTLDLCIKSNSKIYFQQPLAKLCAGRYSEGDFVAHPDNCRLFHICYEGELVESNCEAGNYFNDNVKACLPDTEGKCLNYHEAQVYHQYSNSGRNKRSIRANCIEGSKTPAADCDKYFKCSGGHNALCACEKNHFFNVTISECQVDVNHICCAPNSCTEGEKIPYPGDDTKYYQCVDGKQVLKSCGLNNYFNKLSKTCAAKEECTCPGGFKEGDISAHPSECDKFYKCSDGEQILQNCNKGDYFNKKSLSCEKDVKNLCNVEESCVCAGGYKEGDLSPHPSDCDKYYICLAGKQVLQECYKNNYFDNRTLTCQRDIYKKCWAATDCTCPGGYAKGVVSGHPTDCNKYYICQDGQQMLKNCGTNNYFNNVTLTCQPDTHYVCRPNLCVGQKNGALIANPQQCNGFFSCENGHALAEACLKGQWFDPSESACVDDLKAICYNPCANENSDTVKLLPHPICNEYYFCNGGKTFVGTCLVGSFDIETGVCNETKKCFPNPCDNSSISAFPDPYDPTKFYWCNSEKQPIPSTCPSGKKFDLKYQLCRTVSDPDCPMCTTDGSFNTLYKHKDNEFCVCADGLSTKVECPADYVFSSELGICYSNAPCDPNFCLEANEYDRAPTRNDSKSFCMCINKEANILNCPNNGTFNPYILECGDYEISPECLQSTCIGEPNDQRIFKPINIKTSNGFCQCIDQIATFRSCPYGSTLNPDLLICQLAEINCDSYQCRGLGDKTIIPAVATTQGYCECVGGIGTYYNCPNYSEFNVTAKKCEASLCDLTRCIDDSSDGPFSASTPNGFCMCNAGYIPCPTAGTLYSTIYGNCIEPCPQMLCDAKPDNYLVSSMINKNSFCECHAKPSGCSAYKDCPTKSFIFNETKQLCVANTEELCGTDLCKSPSTFEAKDTSTGFCLCSATGKKPTFEKCLVGIFVAHKQACLPTAEDVCEVSLCAKATFDRPITMPANNSILQFCYCSSPTNAMLLPCPHGKYYDQDKAMCINQLEDNCLCEGEKIADTTTCNKYSICVDGIMEAHICRNDEYFHVELNNCIPDTEGICVKKSNCTCLGIYYENELLPHPVNAQLYYACQGNTLHEHKCQTDRIFSDSQKQCITPYNLRQKRSIDANTDQEFGCLENEKRSVPSNCSQYEICLQQMWKRKSCSNYRYYNPEQRKCLEPRDDFVCSYAKVASLPACNGSTEHYLLSAKTCQQYYRCQGAKWRLKTCGRQQYFDVAKSTCLPLPQDGFFKCELLGNTTIKEVDLKTEAPTPTCQHLSQRFYAKNCAMYLICLENEWWYQYCPSEMYYNRTLNYCVRDIQRQCIDVVKVDVNLDIEEFSKDSCQQDGLLRASLLACNRYFVCLNGKWQIQHCPLVEFYDVANAKCSVDTEGICTQLNKDCVPNERNPNPRNCSTYQQCSNDGKWLKMSCQHNEIYDELLQQCTINQGICSKHGLKRACRENETMLVNHNCSLFYYCYQDTWKLGSCLRGFMYSKENQTCVAHMPQDSCKPLSLQGSPSSAFSSAQASDPCQGKLDGTAVAHSLDCSRYYICLQQSISQEMQCSRGNYFESSLGYCRPNDGSCRLPLTGACANASDDYLVPHPSDCKAFYKCSTLNGTELLYCPAGQYFHNYTSQCRIDHGECKIDMVLKEKCFGFSHGTRLAHERYCNIYYACVKGLAIPIECPDNYQFNSALGKCIQSKEHQCQYGHLKQVNVTYSCGNLSDGFYLPHRKDCTRYYICSQGRAVPKKCSNYRYFDNELLLCVPDDGSCPFVNDNVVHYNTAPPEPIVCEGKHGYLMADPLNCNNFYACIHNKLKHERCYAQQFFNTTLRQCQQKLKFASEVNVNVSKIQATQCLDETTALKNLCSEISKGINLAEPDDCRRYITCPGSYEEPVSQRCRNGESFDSLLGFCRQNDGTCLLENGERVGECSGKHGQVARDPNNCRNYFICINGQKIAQTCKDNEYFGKTQNMCLKDTQQVCNPTQASEVHMAQSCSGLSESVLYPYIHDNCHSYFQCIKGLPKIHKCADDLYFDSLAIKCVKNKTECVMPSSQTMQRSPAFSQTFSKLCSNKKMEHPYPNVTNDCRSFYFCHFNGNVSHVLCPLGMMFNKELAMCVAENKTSCVLSADAPH